MGQMVHKQYQLIKGGWERCRALNPLVYDLADCGVRAECADGGLAVQNPLYDWFQHVQLTFVCGGFCAKEVPLFGCTTMRETVVPGRLVHRRWRTLCARWAKSSARSQRSSPCQWQVQLSRYPVLRKAAQATTSRRSNLAT